MNSKPLLRVLWVCCLTAALYQSALAQELAVSSANGAVAVDNALKPKQLQMELNIRFLAGPNNPLSPLAQDLKVRVDHRPLPCFDIFIPAGCFVAANNGNDFVVKDPLACVQATLVTPPDPNVPNAPPVIEDLGDELISADIRLVESAEPTPCFLKITLRFASQKPQPCFVPLNRAAQAVRLEIGRSVGELEITRIAFTGAPIKAKGSLANVSVHGALQVDDAFDPNILALEYELRFEPGPNSNGINPRVEDLLLDAVFLPQPCFIVFVPAGCFQESKGDLVVNDPAACGVRTLLEFPPLKKGPNHSPVYEDLADDLLAVDIRLGETDQPTPCFYKVEALFASQDPAPCFLPLNRAPQSFELRIGDDSGTVQVTNLSFAGDWGDPVPP